MKASSDLPLALLLGALDEAFERSSWHGTNLRGSLRGLSARDAAWRPAPDRRNAWELVLHAAYWKHVAWRRLTGARGEPFPIDGQDFFERPDARGATDAALRSDVALLVEAHRRLRAAVGGLSPRDLDGAAGARRIRVIRGVTAHDLYHAGQIQLLKRLGPVP